MLSFQALHNKLLFELIPAYTKNLHNAKDIHDLDSSTRVAFKSIADVQFPEEIISFKPKMPDPQEINQEESKLGIDFVAEVTSAVQEFADDQKVFETECDECVTHLAK